MAYPSLERRGESRERMQNLLVSCSKKPLHLMDYYEVLGITSTQERKTITQSELKKRYCALALKYHPDKNQNDQNATLYFQRINEAYQVLSDPKKRKIYDETGQVDLSSLADDPKTFFKHCFGGEAFEDLIGDFFIASFAKDFGEYAESNIPNNPQPENTSLNMDEFLTKERMQQYKDTFEHRVLELASKLLAKIGNYQTGNAESCASFRSSISADCQRLSKEPNAKRLLATIGYVYYTRAKKMIGTYRFFGLPSFWTGIKDTSHIVGKYVQMMNSLRTLDKQASKMAPALPAAESHKTISSEKLNSHGATFTDSNSTSGKPESSPDQSSFPNDTQEDDSDPVLDPKTVEYLMKFVGNITCLEVEAALRRVMKLVIEDSTTLSKKEIVRRSEAIKIIGKMFIETSKALPEETDIFA